MKKFLVFALLCAGIVSTVHSMDECLDQGKVDECSDLGKVLEACPDHIAWYLDRDSFSAMTQVSRLFQRICDAIPVKYLAVTFSDAAAHGHGKLITRFIAQPDGWMFDLSKDEDLIIPEINSDESNSFRIIKRSPGRRLQGFLRYCSVYCIRRNNENCLYLLQWADPEMIENTMEPKAICWMYLNVIDAQEAESMRSLGETLKQLEERIQWPQFVSNAESGCCIWSIFDKYVNDRVTFIDPWRKFEVSGPSQTPENLFKIFGIITTFIIAAQKNHIIVVYAILDDPKARDCLPSGILEVVIHDLKNGNEIKDVVSAVLFERQMAALKISK